ncbi:MAG: MFS transporter [Chloroflexi bacterium]|nr:MFS transporter [Chloroflexota bacterium]
MNFYLSVAFFQGFQVFFLPILREFGWSRTLTSSAFSLRQLESGLLAPVVGFLVDRLSPRVVILLGAIISGAGLVLMSYVTSLWTFYVALLITSVGTSGASHGVSWAVVVSNWFNRLRGRALGIAMLGPVFSGPLVILVVLLEESLGWRGAVRLLGIGVWIFGVPLALVARDRPERYGNVPDGEAVGDCERIGTDGGTPKGATPNTVSSGLTANQAIRTRDFWALSILLGAPFMGVSGLFVHLIPLLEDGGYTTREAAGFLGLIFLLSGIGRVGAGILADLVDRRLVLAATLLLPALGLMLLPGSGPSEYSRVGIFALFLGIGWGGLMTFRPFLVMQLFGSRALGSVQGMVQGVALGLGLAGPVFYGWVFDVQKSYDAALYVSIATMLAVIPLVFSLSTPRMAALRITQEG